MNYTLHFIVVHRHLQISSSAFRLPHHFRPFITFIRILIISCDDYLLYESFFDSAKSRWTASKMPTFCCAPNVRSLFDMHPSNSAPYIARFMFDRHDTRDKEQQQYSRCEYSTVRLLFGIFHDK